MSKQAEIVVGGLIKKKGNGKTGSAKLASIFSKVAIIMGTCSGLTRVVGQFADATVQLTVG